MCKFLHIILMLLQSLHPMVPMHKYMPEFLHLQLLLQFRYRHHYIIYLLEIVSQLILLVG